MDTLQKILNHTAVFVSVYLAFMIPTYLLPYVGSNSAVINAASASSGLGMNPAFWLHLLSLLALLALAWFRGINLGKKWLIIFPVIALIFDFVPGLSSIPLVPTVMHLLTLILGVIITTEPVKQLS